MCDYTPEDYNEIQHIKKKLKIDNNNINELVKLKKDIINKYNKIELEIKDNTNKLRKIVGKYLTTFNKYILIKIFENVIETDITYDNCLCDNVYMTCSYFKNILDNDFTYFIFHIYSNDEYEQVLYIPRQPFINSKQSIAQIFYCECIVNINNFRTDESETLLNVICENCVGGYNIINYIEQIKNIKLNFNNLDLCNYHTILSTIFYENFELSKFIIEKGVNYEYNYKNNKMNCSEFMIIEDKFTNNQKYELMSLFYKHKEDNINRKPIIKNNEFITELMSDELMKNNIKKLFYMKKLYIIGNDNF